ncbi:MAG: acetamidase/formamidase family protein [Anaerolineales bacterium]|nr:acetamidase/formamidase family protein [Anaerolineales bacterium]
MAPTRRRYVPTPDQFVYTFGGQPPVMTVRPGEILDLFTEDALGGQVRAADDVPTEKAQYPYLNPQTGPFYVDGAEPGDTLAIHLIAIRPARDWGVSTISPQFGALVGSKQTANLQPDLPERVWIYDVDAAAGEVIFRALDSAFSTRLPLDPFLGTVGVAPPPLEVRSALVPDSFGGNMDSHEVRAGATLYLGVNVPGALFSIGDGHFAMGDGELCGVAVEGATNTLLTVDVLKATACPWPRLETDDEIMVAGSARPLEDAVRIAHTQLVRWVMETGLSLTDSYQLVSQAARSRIGNVVDPNYTVVAKIAKRYLPPHEWMGGLHAQLRARGQQAMRHL